MVETKTFLTKLREFLLGFEEEETKLEETVSVKLEDMQLEDGTVISAESFEPGQSVFIINPDTEEKLPLPVGEYMLADGNVLEVAEEGIIGEIKAPETPSEEPAANMGSEFVTKADFDAAISEIKSMLSKEVEAKEELSKVNKELQEQIDNIPDAKTIKTTPVELKVIEPRNRKERIYQLMQNQN